MALTPEQATALTQADFDDVLKIEKELDAKLLTAFTPTKPKFEFPLPGPSNGKERPKMKVLMELSRRYEIAGWRTTFVRDADDIYALTLEPAQTIVEQQPSVHHRLMAKEEETHT